MSERAGQGRSAATVRKPTVRPRFDVEDVQILLAAMYVYREQNPDLDVRELYDRIEALSKELGRG